MADPTIKRGPSNEIPALGYDPTTKNAMLPFQIVSVTQDPVTGQWYGVLNVSLGAGSALVGTVEVADSAGTNKLAVDSSGRITLVPNQSVNVAQVGGQPAAMAGSDAQTAANVPEHAIGVYNGTSIDRLREAPSGNGTQTRAGIASIALVYQDPFNAGNYAQAAAATGDAVPAGTVPLISAGIVNSAGSMDRLHGNLDNITLLASGAVSSNGNSGDQTNYNARGIKLFIKTGSFGSGASAITVTLQGKDPVSNTVYTILASASLTASAFTVLSVYPGLAVTANISANDVLPRTWNVAWAASNWGTGGSTLGIACALIL